VSYSFHFSKAEPVPRPWLPQEPSATMHSTEWQPTHAHDQHFCVTQALHNLPQVFESKPLKKADNQTGPCSSGAPRLTFYCEKKRLQPHLT
jgi:hypothetical protein